MGSGVRSLAGCDLGWRFIGLEAGPCTGARRMYKVDERSVGRGERGKVGEGRGGVEG